MKFFVLVLGLLFIHLFILANLQFTAWPEMLSYPYLFNHGFSLYKDFVIPYPPGLVLILSFVYNFFGYSPLILKYFTWGYILVIDLLIFLILKKVSESIFLATLFLGFYILIQPLLDGDMMWFELGMLPFILTEYFFILYWQKTQKPLYLFLAAFFFSISILIKQTAVLYVLPLGFVILQNKAFNYRNIFYLICGIFVLPLFIVYLFLNNLLLDFWNWNIFYPLTAWSKIPDYSGVQITEKEILVCLLLLSSLSFGLSNIGKLIRNKNIILALSFLLTSLFIVYPRLTFFHLQPSLAFLIISLSLIYQEIKSKKLFVAYVFSSFIVVALFLYSPNKQEEIRFYSPSNQVVIEYIKNQQVPDYKIYLLGLNSSFYPLSGTIPPKFWVDNFGWYLEIPGVQEEVVKNLSLEKPRLILRRIPGQGQWFDLGVYQPKRVVDFIYKNYDKKEIIEGDTEVWTIKN